MSIVSFYAIFNPADFSLCALEITFASGALKLF